MPSFGECCCELIGIDAGAADDIAQRHHDRRKSRPRSCPSRSFRSCPAPRRARSVRPAPQPGMLGIGRGQRRGTGAANEQLPRQLAQRREGYRSNMLAWAGWRCAAGAGPGRASRKACAVIGIIAEMPAGACCVEAVAGRPAIHAGFAIARHVLHGRRHRVAACAADGRFHLALRLRKLAMAFCLV